jgi:hypothetical protein
MIQYTKLHCFRCAHPTIVVENRHAMNNCLPPTRLRKKRPENIDHTLWQQTSNIIRLIIKHQTSILINVKLGDFRL